MQFDNFADSQPSRYFGCVVDSTPTVLGDPRYSKEGIDFLATDLGKLRRRFHPCATLYVCVDNVGRVCR